MSLCSIKRRELNIFLIFYIAITAILVYITPFTQTEADILYSNNLYITDSIAKLFNNISHQHWFIRLPFFILSIVNIIFFIKISEIYIKDNIYRNLAIFIFLITPGVFVSFIIVNYATVAIFLLLFFIYSYHNKILIAEILILVLLFFTNIASWVFYLAISIYTYNKKDWKIFIFSTIFLLISLFIGVYPINGVPKGHFIQVLGIYGATLSPFYFLAIVYAVYRLGIDKNRTLLWYIVVTFFTISLLLSIRQKIRITDFTPFIVVSAILVVVVYQNSISIRLKEFQKSYKRVCVIVLTVLLLETSMALFSYPLYLLLEDKFTIIDTSMYKIAKIAKNSNIKCLKTINRRDKALYKYYGIKECK